MSLSEIWTGFKANPIAAMARWQDQRFLWLLFGIVSVALVVVAHSVFQIWLYMQPCEQCVYIRFSFLVIALGSFVAAINPKALFFKLFGYVVAGYGIIIGLMFSVKLMGIHAAVHSTDADGLFGVQGCSTDPSFPFGLPLAQWSPEWFQPTGDCGYEAPVLPDGLHLSGLQGWLVDLYTKADGFYLIPSAHFMSMSECTMLAYCVMAALMLAMLVCWLVTLMKR